MTPASQPVRLALSLLLTAAAVSAQTAPPTTPYLNRNAIVLDPAHGGQDNGASIDGQPEKDITLTLAANLKALLTTRGFTVTTTRDADLPVATPLLTPDQRAGVANHLRPAACIVLHATGTGSGVHLFTSALPLPIDPYEPAAQVRWELAQANYLAQSQSLANDLGLALLRAKIPVVLARTSLRPLDNLTCPALAIEVAPLPAASPPAKAQRPTSPTDSRYQQRIAETLADAILTWRDLTSPKPAPKPAVTPAAGAIP